MRKLSVLIILLGLAAAGFWWFQHPGSTKPTAPVVATINFKKACEIFTLKDAVAVLGDGASQVPSHTDHVVAQKSVTTCFYTYDPGSLSDLVSASLLLQGSSPKDAKQSYLAARPTNAQTIKGYGEAAFWDPSLGQLNILKGQYWLTIDAGSGTPAQRQMDLPRRIADIIMKRV